MRLDVNAVSAQDARTMAAPGAPALAYSASRIASLSSEFTPGDSQLLAPPAGAGCTVVSDPEGYCESPNVLRKVVQSDELCKFVSSITAIFCPSPVIPLPNKGFKS